MKIRCIIVDDEPPAVDELAYILSRIEDVEVVASSNSASKAIKEIRAKKPDLVFLDIHMPVKSGFHVARMVSSFDRPPLIIFATAFDQYAVRAFDVNAIDYVLKPFSEDRIRKSIERAKEVISSKRLPLGVPARRGRRACAVKLVILKELRKKQISNFSKKNYEK